MHVWDFSWRGCNTHVIHFWKGSHADQSNNYTNVQLREPMSSDWGYLWEQGWLKHRCITNTPTPVRWQLMKAEALELSLHSFQATQQSENCFFFGGGSVKLIRESLLSSICLFFILQAPQKSFKFLFSQICLLLKFHVPPSPFWEYFRIEGTPIQHDAVYVTLLWVQLSDQLLSSISSQNMLPSR